MQRKEKKLAIILAKLNMHKTVDMHDVLALDVITDAIIRTNDIEEAYIGSEFWADVLIKSVDKENGSFNSTDMSLLRISAMRVKELNDKYLGVYLTDEVKIALKDELRDEINHRVDDRAEILAPFTISSLLSNQGLILN